MNRRHASNAARSRRVQPSKTVEDKRVFFFEGTPVHVTRRDALSLRYRRFRCYRFWPMMHGGNGSRDEERVRAHSSSVNT